MGHPPLHVILVDNLPSQWLRLLPSAVGERSDDGLFDGALQLLWLHVIELDTAWGQNLDLRRNVFALGIWYMYM